MTRLILFAIALGCSATLLTALWFWARAVPNHVEDNGAASPNQQQSTQVLSAEFERLVKLDRSRTGVFVAHLESGRTAGYNANIRFPMASTYKIPLAFTLLSQADSGALELNQMVEVKAADLRTGSGLLQMIFKQPLVNLSLLSLLELMIAGSDNSATDILLERVGGPDPVTATLKRLGIEDMRVDRSTEKMIRDYNADPEGFSRVIYDSATPAAMTALLSKIWLGEALGPETSGHLINAMRRCQTGPNRIPGILPPKTEVAHKTGSMGSVANDVGVMTLPDGTHVAISVYSIHAGASDSDRDRTIAQIARAAYDYFVFVK